MLTFTRSRLADLLPLITRQLVGAKWQLCPEVGRDLPVHVCSLIKVCNVPLVRIHYTINRTKLSFSQVTRISSIYTVKPDASHAIKFSYFNII